jgi:antitoxin CcdA
MRMYNALAKASASRTARRATNVSLGSEHLAEARELGINISQACERGLVETIAEARAARWLEENREALESSNAWVETNGLPLAHLRLF